MEKSHTARYRGSSQICQRRIWSPVSETLKSLVLATNAVTVTAEKQAKSDMVRESFSTYGANIAAQNMRLSMLGKKMSDKLKSGTVHFLLFLIQPTNAHKCLLQ